jgi:hypothetical protein
MENINNKDASPAVIFTKGQKPRKRLLSRISGYVANNNGFWIR